MSTRRETADAIRRSFNQLHDTIDASENAWDNLVLLSARYHSGKPYALELESVERHAQYLQDEANRFAAEVRKIRRSI